MCVRKINHQKMLFRTITCRDYFKYNHRLLARDIENYDWKPVYTETNVNIALSYREQGLNTIIDRHAPKITKRVKGHKCPWITYKIKKLINTRNKTLKKARKTNKECDWSICKILKSLCNNKIKQPKQKYQKDLLFENRNIPIKFRNCIKEILPLKESVPISVTTNIGNIKNTKNANSPCTFFTNTAKNLKCETFKLRDLICEKPLTPTTTTKSFNFRCVSRIFVERRLISLKHRKADGCDNLPPGILKDAAYAISIPLTHLINLSLSTGLVPNKWKIAKVTPIHKKGNTNDCNNYLQISVLNTCSKILKELLISNSFFILRSTIFFQKRSLVIEKTGQQN